MHSLESNQNCYLHPVQSDQDVISRFLLHLVPLVFLNTFQRVH